MSQWSDILGWSQQQIAELQTLAFCYARQGVYQVARDLLHLLQAIDPQSAYEAQLLGAIYLEQGELKQALHWLARALTLDPAHGMTQLNMAKALLASGSLPEGLSLAAALQTCPDPLLASDAQALILAYRRAA
jgi:predicted Zn-dependent protease